MYLGRYVSMHSHTYFLLSGTYYYNGGDENYKYQRVIEKKTDQRWDDRFPSFVRGFGDRVSLCILYVSVSVCVYTYIYITHVHAHMHDCTLG